MSGQPSENAPFTLIATGLDALIAAAPASPEKFQIKRVFQGTGTRAIRISFAAGQVMREHSSNVPILVQVLQGHIIFRVAGEQLQMPVGAIVHVEPDEMHELEAVTESHVLLMQSL